MKSSKLSIKLDGQLSELDKLCQHLESYCGGLGLSPKNIFETHLILEELFTNIVSYGLTPDQKHSVGIELNCRNDTLTIRIEDEGIAFNPILAGKPDTNCRLAERKIGGLGIHLAKQFSSDIKYQRKGKKNILTIIKKIGDA
jgi:serine/threonine-protein kinase RsbW